MTSRSARSTRPSRRDLLRLGGLTAAGLAAPGLAGCGGEGASSDDNTLQFMYWGSTFEDNAMKEMLEQFKERSKDLTVEPLYTPSTNYGTKLNTLVASNRPPDLAYTGGGTLYRAGEQGKLINLYKYVDKYPELADRFPYTYYWWDKEKLAATQTANEVMLLWYNKKAFDEAGVDYPPAEADQAWTWDQFLEAAYKLTKDQDGRSPDESGFDSKRIRQFGVAGNWNSYGWYPLVRSNGGEAVDETGTKYLLDMPETVEVFQALQDLTYEHHVAPSPAQLATGGAGTPTTPQLLQTRRVAMALDGQWLLLDMWQSDIDYGIGVLPKFQEPVTNGFAAGTVAFTGKGHDEEAVDLYMFHNDPRYVDLYKQGLWMPLERKYYTDPELIDSWIKNDAHPPEFRTAVVDYTLNNSVEQFDQRLKNTDNISEVMTPAMQQIQNGKRSAKDVLTELETKFEPLLKGYYPIEDLS